MFVISAVVFQDIGDATSVSLLNLDPSEHTPEVICDTLRKHYEIIHNVKY